jgi:lipoprotein-anchoring transpeptidase ErfK/SrfK
MSKQRVVAAGRRGELSPRRPAGAFLGMRAAAIGAALWTVLAGAAQAQRPASTQGGRERGVGRLTTRESAGVVDSALLATVADSLATASREVASPVRPTVPSFARFRSRADSVAYETTRARAERDNGLRVVVSLLDRELYVVDHAADTLLVADVAIGVDTTITYGAKSWRFETPRGRRTVLRKQESPVWIPPEWHYVEVAAKRGLKLAHLRLGKPVPLSDGTSLTTRDGRVGRLGTDGLFTALPTDEEIVFDGTVFVPPLGTENRRIPGELGRFKMELGDGYMLHGTPHENTIGQAATHGCIRLYDEDIEWLYRNIPAGTPVYIF